MKNIVIIDVYLLFLRAVMWHLSNANSKHSAAAIMSEGGVGVGGGGGKRERNEYLNVFGLHTFSISTHQS